MSEPSPLTLEEMQILARARGLDIPPDELAEYHAIWTQYMEGDLLARLRRRIPGGVP